jgi:hypothetical protein
LFFLIVQTLMMSPLHTRNKIFRKTKSASPDRLLVIVDRRRYAYGGFAGVVLAGLGLEAAIVS